MKVSEALDSRMSCRAFLPGPRSGGHHYARILEAASGAPSGGNLQPWFADILTGAPLAALIEQVRALVPQFPLGYTSEYPVYPSPLGEPYRTRRHQEWRGSVRHDWGTAERPSPRGCGSSPATTRGLGRARPALHQH